MLGQAFIPELRAVAVTLAARLARAPGAASPQRVGLPFRAILGCVVNLQIPPDPQGERPEDLPVAPAPPVSLRQRAWRFWSKHRTLFWTLHSVWALATGVLIIWLAQEQYGFVPWVVLFLGLTWLSTLYFGRKTAPAAVAGADTSQPPGPAAEATSYVTRVMYQETLFFLLPFYAYSMVLDAPNVLFMVLLGSLAILSCIDLVFDRWLRTSQVRSLLFFALVTFAAVNLLIPMLVPVDPALATKIAAGVAVMGALPLALQGKRPSRKDAGFLALATAIFLAVVIGFPRLIPPVPLRLQEVTFAAGIDRETLEPIIPLQHEVGSATLGDGLYVRILVFAPTVVPAQVNLRWELDGETIRDTRTIDITAHAGGFRIWDVWRPESGPIEPGRYDVILEMQARRVFGTATIVVQP
jgi:hypothetical protein